MREIQRVPTKPLELRQGRKVKQERTVFNEVAATYKRRALQEELLQGDRRRSGKKTVEAVRPSQLCACAPAFLAALPSRGVLLPSRRELRAKAALVNPSRVLG